MDISRKIMPKRLTADPGRERRGNYPLLPKSQIPNPKGQTKGK